MLGRVDVVVNGTISVKGESRSWTQSYRNPVCSWGEVRVKHGPVVGPIPYHPLAISDAVASHCNRGAVANGASSGILPRGSRGRNLNHFDICHRAEARRHKAEACHHCPLHPPLPPSPWGTSLSCVVPNPPPERTGQRAGWAWHGVVSGRGREGLDTEGTPSTEIHAL